MGVCDRYDAICGLMRKAAEHAGRAPDSVSLTAVTKTKSAEEFLPLIKRGHRLFGENRVQEAKEKYAPLKERFPDIELHLIGHLQTNKVRDAVALFDSIDVVDSEELAEKLAAEMKRQNRFLPVYVQVNTGLEEQKGGVDPRKTADFVQKCRDIGLNVVGLMCIPPVNDEPSPHFALLKKLARELGVERLSMGMSDDFDIAIEQGATTVRVGSALFGERKQV